MNAADTVVEVTELVSDIARAGCNLYPECAVSQRGLDYRALASQKRLDDPFVTEAFN